MHGTDTLPLLLVEGYQNQDLIPLVRHGGWGQGIGEVGYKLERVLFILEDGTIQRLMLDPTETMPTRYRLEIRTEDAKCRFPQEVILGYGTSNLIGRISDRFEPLAADRDNAAHCGVQFLMDKTWPRRLLTWKPTEQEDPNLHIAKGDVLYYVSLAPGGTP